MKLNNNIVLKLQKSILNKKYSVKISTSKPFFVNPRAKLIHRPKAIELMTHLYDAKPRLHDVYFVVECFCGYNFCTKGNEYLTSQLLENDIVCKACELKAIDSGLPSSSSINGSHVHIGGIKAFGCCNSVSN